MANRVHVARLKEDLDVWNQWRKQNPHVRPDLIKADLNGMDLRKADLHGVDLFGVDLSGADLSGADLSGVDLYAANLYAANLSRADLSDADLNKAHLDGADLAGAVLIIANLSGAKLAGAKLTSAHLGETILADLDLSRTVGLESCVHEGPSPIDHRTLARSGRLPLQFLRGCGLPDAFIDYIPSLFHQAIEFHSCFISYSTKDQEFADRLYADLQNKGVRCWFAPHDIQGGKKVHEQIDAAIQMHDRLLLLLSESSMNSEWVKTEIAKAAYSGDVGT
jgi:uncharacterized protein YjbI with pentapeptide repeats